MQRGGHFLKEGLIALQNWVKVFLKLVLPFKDIIIKEKKTCQRLANGANDMLTVPKMC
jgi:hypothetical protein